MKRANARNYLTPAQVYASLVLKASPLASILQPDLDLYRFAMRHEDSELGRIAVEAIQEFHDGIDGKPVKHHTIFNRVTGKHDEFKAQVMSKILGGEIGSMKSFSGVDGFVFCARSGDLGELPDISDSALREVYEDLCNPPAYYEVVARYAALLDGMPGCVLQTGGASYATLDSRGYLSGFHVRQEKLADVKARSEYDFDESGYDGDAWVGDRPEETMFHLFRGHVIDLSTPEIDQFRGCAESPLEVLRLLIEDMPSKGDREEDCQRLVLLNRLNDLERAIESVCQNDLVPDGEDLPFTLDR
jgi:hypothetical protein